MSEPIPEAIPTSADPRSRRPIKRARGANIATTSQADAIETLFLDPDRPVNLPASSAESKSKLALPPEIVANVQGSSAGAGSGEFHVYKASRRREYERLRLMDEEAKKEVDDEKWANELDSKRLKDQERTRKNREKRNKRKGKQGQAKKEGTPGEGQSEEQEFSKQPNGNTKRTLHIPKREDNDEKASNNTVGVAELVQENGITIHDDD